MTPEKRSFYLKVFGWSLAALLLVGGYITQDIWLAAVMGM